MNEKREVKLRTLANKLKYFGPRTPYPIVMSNGAKAIVDLLGEVDTITAERDDLRRQVADLEELLRREEARG